MSSVVIRPATGADVEALAALARDTYTAAFGHSFSAADLAAHLAAQLAPYQVARMMQADVFLVAQLDGRLVGFVQLGGTGADGAEQTLRRLYVHSDFQNQGIGDALLEAALEHPRLVAAETVVLDVWEHNHGAQRFYRRHGFEVVGTRRFEVASGAETSLDLIMVRHRPSGGL